MHNNTSSDRVTIHHSLRAHVLGAALIGLAFFIGGLRPDGNCHVNNDNNSCDPGDDVCQDVGPVVTIDPLTGAFLLDGRPFLPVGFWGFYSSPPCGVNLDCEFPPCVNDNGNWSCEWEAYCGEVYDWSVYSSFNAFVKGPDNSFDEGRERYGIIQFLQTSRSCQYVGDWCDEPGIAAWEVVHEPNLPVRDCDGEHFHELAEAIAGRDPCGRPVFTTPSGGGISDGEANDLGDYAPYIDFAALQAGYTVPHFRAARCGTTTQRGYDILNPPGQLRTKPALSIIRISGYQPCRFLHTYREPTYAELRVQAFDALIHGARAIMFYPFDAGISGDPWGRGPATYNVEDSPPHLANLQAIGAELIAMQDIFASPLAGDITIHADAHCRDREEPCMDCQAWEVSAPEGSTTQIICANVAEQPSAYFSYKIGGNSRPLPVAQSRLKVDPDDANETPMLVPASLPQDPEWDCDDDNDPVGCKTITDSTVMVQDIYTGEEAGRRQLQYFLTQFSFRVAQLVDPCGDGNKDRKVSVTLYVDDLRDDSPHSPVRTWKVRVPEPGQYELAIDPPQLIEPTRRYFMIVRSVCGSVSLFSYFGNVGAQAIDRVHPPRNGVYPPLIQGRSLEDVSIAITPQTSLPISGYCEYRDANDSGTFHALDGAAPAIEADFAAYAVHRYQLYRGTFDDCNADGVPDDCGDACLDFSELSIRCLDSQTVEVTVTLADSARSGECVTVNVNGIEHSAVIEGNLAMIVTDSSAGPIDEARLTCPENCGLAVQQKSCSEPAP
ncbi:MAG: hypothetical protein IT449_16920 [Phycisphaerales bacterium]|nr:hypothetical protein [Phycisphaerales bacterium]